MTDWSQAACQGADPALFFPKVAPNAKHPPWELYAVAERHCRRCPIRDACFDFADRTNAEGLFAGMYWRYTLAPIDLLATEEAAA